jgi:ACS family sodium-dependent inorganic phosphate cotransporter
MRKLLQCAGLLGAATCLLLLQRAGSATAAAALMCGATGILSLCAAGFACNPFDIAPEYAEVIWGISNTVATLPGIVGIAVTGWLVDRTGAFTAPFFLAAGVALAGAALYFAFASGEREIS